MALNGVVFTKEQIFTDLKADDNESLLEMISKRMNLQGLVKEGFGEAVISREEKYPTGLPTVGLGVAMPHTDADHVIKESFSLSILPNPVVFREMGNPSQSVLVHIVFTLALKDNHTQLDMLHGIVSMIQKGDFLEAMYREKDPEKIHDMVMKEFESVSWE